ncbi:MAG: hypothetical protein KGL12_14745 [Rhodospirillales bacterium]|nr:hypothetical protein [Rhodospirillales bacterium]
MRPYPHLSADTRPVNRSRAHSRPGLVAVACAFVVVALLTLGLHFLFR